jgi:hypothetical protein
MGRSRWLADPKIFGPVPFSVNQNISSDLYLMKAVNAEFQV